MFETVTRPIAELLAPLFGVAPEELQPKIEGLIWLVIIIFAVIFGWKIYKWWTSK